MRPLRPFFNCGGLPSDAGRIDFKRGDRAVNYDWSSTFKPAKSSGFVRYAQAPAKVAEWRVTSVATALIMITGVADVEGCRRNRSQSVRPSPSGNKRSNRITPGKYCRALFNASVPLVALRIWYPQSRNRNCNNSAKSNSSSTNSMLFVMPTLTPSLPWDKGGGVKLRRRLGDTKNLTYPVARKVFT